MVRENHWITVVFLDIIETSTYFTTVSEISWFTLAPKSVLRGIWNAVRIVETDIHLTNASHLEQKTLARLNKTVCATHEFVISYQENFQEIDKLSKQFN